MEINFNYNGNDLILVYDDNGILEHIINTTKNNKKMMFQFIQHGMGYELEKNNEYMSMDVCTAIYVRIMELDVFVPKFIFIPNGNSTITKI